MHKCTETTAVLDMLVLDLPRRARRGTLKNLTVVDRDFHHHPVHVCVRRIREPHDADSTRPLTSTGFTLTCEQTWRRSDAVFLNL